MARKIKTIPAAKDPRRRPNGQIVKGVRPAKGRQRGTPNKRTTILKDAILQAAAFIGQDGKGRDGLVGYLMMLATKERAVYARLLEKVLPMQVHVQEDGKKYTVEEAIERLRERNLPVPPSLAAMIPPRVGVAAIAHKLNDQHGDGVTDELDNRLFSDEDYEAELGGDDKPEDGS